MKSPSTAAGAMSTAASPVPSTPELSAVAVVLGRATSLGVRISCRQEVADYLEAHADVVDLTACLCERARLEFPDGELVLKVNHDPEIYDPYLILHARLWPYPPNMRERLYSVWAPFEAQLCDTSGSIVVSTDCRKPEEDREPV